MSYKKVHYDSKVCPVCGHEFIPQRITQRICLDPECRLKAKRQALNAFRKENYTKAYGDYDMYRRSPISSEPKKDTIVAIGYAERQIADSLAKAGKIKVEL